MSTCTVLTIDDDPFMQKVIKKEIEHAYTVKTANCGQAGIDKAINEQPDIIILDVEMPGMNGYEVCDTLKHTADTRDIPVVFLSSLSNIRSKMIGYEAGGADFLVKPFQSGELISKLNALVKLIAQNKKIQAEIKQATTTAFRAMKDSSELGQCINFIETTYSIKDFDSLATSFFNVCNSMSLSCSLMFLIRDKRIFYSSNGNRCPALEEDVIGTIFNNGRRFVDFGCRTQINYSHVALLIKNMPLDDLESYGRLKDFFPFMLGATDAKVKSLEAELGVIAQTKGLTKAFDTVQSNLLQIKEGVSNSQEAVVNLLTKMLTQLEDEVLFLGLDSDQEKKIIGIIDQTIVSSQKVIDTSEYNAEIFSNTTSVLKKLIEKQQLLADSFKSEPVQAQTTAEENGDDLSDDVELF